MWINNATVEQARLAIAAGAVGCTNNPAYAWKMIESDPENTVPVLDRLLAQSGDDSEVLVLLQKALADRIASEFLPIFERSRGKLGYVTVQGDPFRETRGAILRQARLNRAGAPNIMAKIPVIPEGLAAIEILAGEGVPLCCTEVMAVRQAADAAGAFALGAAGRERPAACVIAHIAGIYDEYLQSRAQKEGAAVEPDILWQAGVAVAKKVHALIHERGWAVGFLSGGARGLHHFTELVGSEGAVTINWAGCADALLRQDPPVICQFARPTPMFVLDELARRIPDFRRGYELGGIEPAEYESFGPVVLFRGMFEQAWQKALKFIGERRRAGSGCGRGDFP
jgi:transaldolase